jgi:hypothetical protein
MQLSHALVMLEVQWVEAISAAKLDLEIFAVAPAAAAP